MHTHRGEPLYLLGGQHAQRRGNIDLNLIADRFDSGSDLGHQPLIGSAHSRDDAELGGAGLSRLLRGFHQAGHVEPGTAHRRFEQPRLRTEMAVLWAAAGLQADDALNLDFGSAPAHSHVVGQR